MGYFSPQNSTVFYSPKQPHFWGQNRSFGFRVQSRTEIRREPFIRAALVLDKTCSYKWYSSRLIFPRINGPIVKHMRTLRSSSGISLVTPMESGTFQDEATKLFNKLPLSVRNCSNINTFSKATFNYLMDRLNNTWLWSIVVSLFCVIHKVLRGKGLLSHSF